MESDNPPPTLDYAPPPARPQRRSRIIFWLTLFAPGLGVLIAHFRSVNRNWWQSAFHVWNLAQIGNAFEALLWSSMGIGLYIWNNLRQSPPTPRINQIALVLLIFGQSDIVEINTGAWWRPWWLLLWKAACILALAILLLAALSEQRHSRQRLLIRPTVPPGKEIPKPE